MIRPTCIEENVPLAPRTTLGVGGNAQYFAIIKSVDELSEVITWARYEKKKITILGGGSNVLVRDTGVAGLVLKMEIGGNSFESQENGNIQVFVGAGIEWDTFVKEAADRELWGAENLSGIPGSVGAAPVQNINAYGSSVSDIIVRVDAYHSETGEARSFTKTECCFGYRDSVFKTEEGKKYIITRVVFELSKQKDLHIAYKSSSQSIEKFLEKEKIITPTSHDIRRAVLSIRKNIGMLQGIFKSAGSFFKNTVLTSEEFSRLDTLIQKQYAEKSAQLTPWHWHLPDGREKVSTAFLMECSPYNKTAYAGKAYNNTVGISPLHSLSLINVNDATASDVMSFAEHIIHEIEKEFGVTIEYEVCVFE